MKWALPAMGYRWDGFRKPRRQVLKRIRNRIYELELSGGFEEYMGYLEANPDEWAHLDRLCYVTISKFFRDRKLWDYIRNSLLPELVQKNAPGPVTAWSAGCCNGEEPYSLAIIHSQMVKKNIAIPALNILASDRYAEVLERGYGGVYPAESLKELNEKEIQNSFSVLENGSKKYKIRKSITRNVVFEQRDIRESLPDQLFDLVFCRNLVFTYFTDEHRKKFTQRLKPRLNPGGFLIIGSNENIPETKWLEKRNNTYPVYQKRFFTYFYIA